MHDTTADNISFINVAITITLKVTCIIPIQVRRKEINKKWKGHGNLISDVDWTLKKKEYFLYK